MNQVFEFKRWSLLLTKHWSENKRKYTLGLLAIAGLLFSWFLFYLVMDGGRPIPVQVQGNTFIVGIFLMGCLFGSFTFSDLASGPKAMNHLIFPASQFEKLLCSMVYSIVFFFIAYTATFYLVDLIMVQVGNSFVTEGASDAPETKVVNIFTFMNDESPNGVNAFYYIMIGYLTLQSAFILGSIYFPKYSFIKTTISMAVLVLILIFFVGKVLLPLMPEGGYYNGITSYRLQTNFSEAQFKTIELPEWVSDSLLMLMIYGVAPLLWIVTYFRLKEKEA